MTDESNKLIKTYHEVESAGNGMCCEDINYLFL